MTGAPLLGVGIGGSMSDVVRLAREVEAAGFESAWVAELERSAFVQSAAALAATSALRVGTAVALAFPRSPTTTAMEARDLAELSGGRFLLGLGTQVKRVVEARYSVAFDRPAARLEEYARAVRTVWAAGRGETVTHEGLFYRITMPTFGTVAARRGTSDDSPTPSDPPILFAAVGPLLSRAAGRVADGLVGHPLASPRYLAEAVSPAIAAGLADAGRPSDACPISASVMVAIADDEEVARREAKRQIAFYATTPSYRPILRMHGREAIYGDLRRAFVRRDLAAMERLVDDELCDAIAAAGDVATVRDRLAAWGDVAVRLILAGPWYGVPRTRTVENTSAIVDAFGRRTAADGSAPGTAPILVGGAATPT